MKKILTLLLLSFGLATLSFGQDSYGQDFWIAAPSNASPANAEVYITAQSTATVTVAMPGLSFTTTITVNAGTLQKVTLPAGHQVAGSGTSNLGIHITSNVDITVYLMNERPFSTDAYLALPVDALGVDYMALSFAPSITSYPGQLTIVATENGTTISINSGASISLNEGQVYQLSSGTIDYTGYTVTSNKPVAVFTSVVAVNIPAAVFAADHIVEQIPPTTAWGISFIATSLATRTGGDIFRFLAKDNATQISVNGTVVATLAAGQFYETSLASNSIYHITSNNPILVGQFAKGEDADGVVADPFFALVPPDDQFLTNYILSSGTANIPNNYVNITCQTTNTGAVLVDNVGVPAGDWTAVSGTSFSTATVLLANGVHTVSSTLPIGVLAYGFGSYDGYGYLGGQSFSPVATVCNNDFGIKNINSSQAQKECVEATIVDCNNNPVVGVKVDFTVQGANIDVGFAITDALGKAVFCYITANPGLDTIIGSVAGSMDTVYNAIAPSTLSITPTSGTIANGANNCVTATVLDGNNLPVANAQVVFTVSATSANPGTMSYLTNASGMATHCYIGANAGWDTMSVAAGALTQSGLYQVLAAGNNSCATTNSFGPIWINPAYKAAGANDPQTYYWGLSEGTLTARPQNGVGPYTYQWSSSEGYAIKNDTKKRARLWYPTGPQWVTVEITDVGAGCTIEDSVYVDWVDYTCNQPSIWYYELCNVNTNTTSCVQGTVNMRNLVSTGDYVFGPCGVPKTNWGIANDETSFEVELFPNPNNGQFSYELTSSKASSYVVTVLDLNGRVLYSETVDNTYNNTIGEVNLSQLSAGMYLFQISNENNSAVKRFVIQ